MTRSRNTIKFRVLIWATFALSVTFVTSSFAQNVPERPTPSLDLVDLARQTYIFQLAPNTSPAELQRIAREAASIGGGRPMHIYTTVMRGFSAHVSDAGLVRIREGFPEILRIYRSNIFSISEKPPSTPGGGGSGDSTGGSRNLRSSSKNSTASAGGEIIPWGVARVLPKQGNNTVIQDATGGPKTLWVLDTGVDLNNPDLHVDKGRSVNCVSFRGKDTPDDENGHGTHVAGTAAAIGGNNIDVVGVAAGATVVSVRVLDRRGSGTTAEVVCGIDYVAAHGTASDVVNMSLGGPADLVLDDAVLRGADLGILFSLAAGNEATDAITRSPARVRHGNVYTVSAIDSKDVFASFSNHGNPPVDRAAPGVQVVSLKRGGGTDTKSGTSMAAPHVAGLLLLGKIGCDGTAIGDPDSKPDAIAHLLGSSCPSPDGPGM
jgi:hypothetical protein